MADAMISQLSAAAALADTDLLEVEQGVDPTNTSGKLTVALLKAFILASQTRQKRPVTALGIAAGVVTIDLQGGINGDFTLVLTENVTSIVFTNMPAAGFIGEFEIEFAQDTTGGRTVTLPASFKALGGSDTAVAAGINAVTVLSAKTFDQGTTWRYAMQESA